MLHPCSYRDSKYAASSCAVQGGLKGVLSAARDSEYVLRATLMPDR